MPPLPVSAVALPGAFISVIIEGNQEKDLTDSVKEQQNTLLATSSADKEAVFSCIQRIDDKIRSVKTEALQIILDHKDVFVKLYNDSVSLRYRIDTLFTEVDNVSQEVNRPETGMRPKLIDVLQENRSVMQEVQNTNSVVETLEYLSEVFDMKYLIGVRFHEYLDQGRIEEAAGTITHMDSLLESPPVPTERKIQIFDRLKLQLSIMKESLDQTLDDLLTQSISFKKIDDEGSNLTVLSSVEGRLMTIFTARFIIGPDLNDKSTIQETFEFKRFDEVANDVICFQAEMRKMGFMRESRGGEEEEERTLGSYVAKVDVHFTIKKRDKLLELGRNVMMDVNFESEEITEEQDSEQNDNVQETLNNVPVIESSKIDEINEQKEDGNKDLFAIQNDNNNPNDGWEVDWNEGWDGDDDWDKSNNSQNHNENLISKNIISEQGIKDKKLVRYSISNKGKALIDLVIKTLNEIRNLNAKSGIRLYQATLDLFDLYRAVMPVFHHNTFSNVPALAMLFRNDCLWLADQLLVVQDQFKDDQSSPSNSGETVDIKGKISYNDTIEKLRELGKTWYDIQMDKQKSILKEILDEMGGVQQIANDERFEACQSAMNQLKEINSIEKYIKHRTKFRHMTDILDLPLAGIMSRFRNGELVCFTIDELEGLICALFSDTPLRENTLSEIREGLPVGKEHYTEKSSLY
ncbi:8250_t:CDS:10 [Funneliformis mosseae]|uniref:8250_t:CDS:1 n=1 Tax=Funneliformis mosseae TaxID=27381 RepID=A0A9N9EN89_FUNMO|nr:8250_t:CDS:10 [Funneliformis mosseae]